MIYLSEKKYQSFLDKLGKIDDEIEEMESTPRNQRDKSWDERLLTLINEKDFISNLIKESKIIPIEENWETTAIKAGRNSLELFLISNYPSGLIIKNK